MHGAPSVRIDDIGGGRVWRCAVAVLGLTAMGCVAAWLLGREDVTLLAGGGVVAASALAVAAAATLLQAAPRELRFDGTTWWLDRGSGAAPVAGGLQVAVDLGGFLLVRFRPEGLGTVRWLPLERRRDADWHLLRCAVYSPRSGPAMRSADAPRPPE